MKKTANISTVIDVDVKRAATQYCKEHGLKLQYLIEKALVELLEDVIDLDAVKKRKSEETVSLESILMGLKK